MGRILVSRTAAGVTFLVESAIGQTVAVSKTYANLDACKKGIVSLKTLLPTLPVVEKRGGERVPNPKCEIVCGERGVTYLVKSVNGKTVLASPAYATKKACLRAFSMLKHSVEEGEVLLDRCATLVPLTVGRKAKSNAVAPVQEPVANVPEVAAVESQDVAPSVQSTPTPAAPRLVRLSTVNTTVHRPTAAPKAAPAKKKGLFEILFGK